MANEYLKRTPTSTGNRKTFTISFWKKHSQGGGSTLDFSAVGNTVNDNNNRSIFYWSSGNQFDYYHNVAGVAKHRRTEPADNTHQDFSSWYHVLVSTDTTKNESRIYLNGIEINYNTGFTVDTINYETWYNSPYLHSIGAQFGESFHNKTNYFDWFLVDGQALTPDVFGFYKEGKGYVSAGSTQATDFRPGQWVPKTPRIIKAEIERRGGFGVNGFYLPMNDSSNFGADFHCEPNSIITLKGEDLPQPRNGAPETTDAYVSQLRTDPYAANLVLAVPGISTYRGPELVTDGTFSTGSTGSWLSSRSASLSIVDGKLRVTNTSLSTSGAHLAITCEVGKVYNFSFEISGSAFDGYVGVTDSNSYGGGTFVYGYQQLSNGFYSVTFRAASTTQYIHLHIFGGTTGNYKDFDNISVREEALPSDYSAHIKGSGTNKTLTANGGVGIAQIPSYYGSALSFDGTGDYLQSDYNSDWDLGSDDFTIECWVKTTDTTTNYPSIVGRWQSAGNACWDFRPQSTDASDNFIFIYSTDGTNGNSINSGKNICTGDLYHLAAERNGTSITLYVNGVASAVHNIGSSTIFNTSNVPLYVGYDPYGSSYYNGIIQDLRIYKGVAKYKGGFDVPKPYTPVGISTWRAVPDCTANNFATLNPLVKSSNTFTNGNLTSTMSASPPAKIVSNIGVSTGKWYAEYYHNGNNNYPIGISADSISRDHLGVSDGNTSISFWISSSGTQVYVNGNLQSFSGSSTTWASGDIAGLSLDHTNKQVSLYKNGVLVGSAWSYSSYNWTNAFFAAGNYISGNQYNINFGQNPTFSGNTTAGTYTDSNGKGLFKYQPPSGFLALCEDNLPTPAVADPGDYFKTVLWTGDGAARSITGIGFTPDLVWVKLRNTTGNHSLYDSVRGVGQRLSSSLTNAEATFTNSITSFDSTGFSLGSNSDGDVNASGNTYVAWCWKAGGAAVSNTDGSITSQVSVNQDAGFSIVSWTGDGVNGATLGHGLGKRPKLIITKRRQAVQPWYIWTDMTTNVTANNGLGFDTNAVSAFNFGHFTSLNTTTATLTQGGSGIININTSGSTYIAYCWAEIEGFSKFGSYIGNGSADGPFVYTGGKPAFVMIKSTTVATNWYIFDNSRQSTNPVTGALFPNTDDIETFSAHDIDFLSNGFKIRQAAGYGANNSGESYIYACWMESPFTTANAK